MDSQGLAPEARKLSKESPAKENIANHLSISNSSVELRKHLGLCGGQENRIIRAVLRQAAKALDKKEG